MDMPRIMIQEKRLSLLIAKEDERFCVYCPELDLVTAMDTYEDAIDDMVEAKLVLTDALIKQALQRGKTAEREARAARKGRPHRHEERSRAPGGEHMPAGHHKGE